MPITIRPIQPDELVDWYRSLGETFFMWPSDPPASAAFRKDTINYQRTLAAFDGNRMVGTYRTFPADMTLPGLRSVPVSCVSAVTVLPTHRRRGILTQLIDLDVAQGLERGDVASILYAAEWPIYGRYGYGPASWSASWEIRARSARFLTPPVGTVDIRPPADVRDLLPEIYARYAAQQPGEISRVEHSWDLTLGLVQRPAGTGWKGHVAVHLDPSGRPDGYLRYSGQELWERGMPDNVATVDELVGVTADAEVALWQYISSADLVATVKASGRRVREPLTWHLADARAAEITRIGEGLWLRPYDVARLLGSRSYAAEADLVIEVVDELNGRPGPAAGRYRLEASRDGASCRATTDAADLRVDVRALGAACLGGTRLRDAARAGAAIEHRPGALGEADLLLRGTDDPWCYTFF
jgi:predicted acetyltransferase